MSVKSSLMQRVSLQERNKRVRDKVPLNLEKIFTALDSQQHFGIAKLSTAYSKHGWMNKPITKLGSDVPLQDKREGCR